MSIMGRLQRGLQGGTQGLQQALLYAMLPNSRPQTTEGLTAGESDFVNPKRRALAPTESDADLPSPDEGNGAAGLIEHGLPFGLGQSAADRLPRRRRYEPIR